MSDEFSTPNRTFASGHDPIWTALHKNDYTNAALHYYHPDNVRTNEKGQLSIDTTVTDNTFISTSKKGKKQTETKHYQVRAQSREPPSPLFTRVYVCSHSP